MGTISNISKNTLKTYSDILQIERQIACHQREFTRTWPKERDKEIQKIKARLDALQSEIPNDAPSSLNERVQCLRNSLQGLEIRAEIANNPIDRPTTIPTTISNIPYEVVLSVREFLPEECGNALNTTCKGLRTHTREATTNFDFTERTKYRRRMAEIGRQIQEKDDADILFARLIPIPNSTVKMLLERGPLLTGRVNLFEGDEYFKQPITVEEFASIFTGKGLFHRLKELVVQIPQEPKRPPQRAQPAHNVRRRAAGNRQIAPPPPAPELRNIAMTNMGLDCPQLQRLVLISPTLDDMKLVLRNFRRVPEIELRNCNSALFNAEFVAMATLFPKLKISVNHLNRDNIAHLAQIAALEELTLINGDFTWSDLEPLAHLPRLNSLSFTNCSGLSKKGTVAVMAASKSLRNLDFRSQDKTTLQDLPPNFNLDHLRLDSIKVSSTEATALAKGSIRSITFESGSEIYLS